MQMELGQIVKSLAGRDRGQSYLIIGFTAGSRVLLADGRVRTVTRPKKKNMKHLQPYRCVLPEIKEKIQQGNLNDNVVRNALNNFFARTNHGCDFPCLRTSSTKGLEKGGMAGYV